MDGAAGQVINVFDLRDSPWVDGPGRTVLETAAHIDSGRFHFIVGGFASQGETENVYLDTAREKGLEIVKITERAAFDRNIVSQLRQLIKDNNIHILHTHEFRSNLYGLLAARGTGVKLTSTCHGWITNSRKRRLFKFLDKQLLKRFQFVTTVSERIRDELIGSGIPPEKVQFLQNALILDRYQRQGNGVELRARFGLGADDVLIAKIGRLSPEKNQLSLIRALADLPGNADRVRLLLVGKGPDETMLRREAEQLGVQDRVLFLGYREDMLSIYEISDLVIQSSFTEGMPNVVLEALAMEVPVIATDVGGTSQIITPGETGELLGDGQPATIGRAISTFLDNPGSYREMARKGRRLIHDKFDFRQRTETLMQTYDALVSGRPATVRVG